MKIVVFTDLDGTLLDAKTYSWRSATTAIHALKDREAVIVLVTSKTLAEVELLHEELGLADPFIFENGGGIAAPRGTPVAQYLLREMKIAASRHGRFAISPMGVKYEMLVESLADISAEIGASLVGFSSMSQEQVAEVTGLEIELALKARRRFFDEPFVVPKELLHLETQILNAAKRRGLSIAKGDRFWHLMGHAGKGEAVSVLLGVFRDAYREFVTIGIGDSPNDFPFLELVDIPVLLGKPTEDHPLLSHMGVLRPSETGGPEAWNKAILDLLDRL